MIRFPVKAVPHKCPPFNGRPCQSWSVEGVDSLYNHPMDKDEAEAIVKALNAAMKPKKRRRPDEGCNEHPWFDFGCYECKHGRLRS